MASSGELPARAGTASSSDLVRWGGLAAVVGGALSALGPVGEDVLGGGGYPESPAYRPYSFVGAAELALLIAGLIALRARYKGEYGRPGKAGFVVVLGAYALMLAGIVPSLLFPFPSGGLREAVLAGQTLGFLGALLAGAGAILLGLGLRRTRGAPRLGALLLIGSLPVGFPLVVALSATGLMEISGLAFTVPYGCAWVVLGHRLWSERSALQRSVPRA